MNMLTLSHVSKHFGNHQVIKDLSLKVLEGTIYGFIGQNGAGKTTTMKISWGNSHPGGASGGWYIPAYASILLEVKRADSPAAARVMKM